MSRPRPPSFLGQAKRSFWLFFGGIWLLAGVVLLVVAFGMALQERAWASDAVQTSGIVLTKDIIPADSDSSTQYRVRFRFTTQDGTTVEGNQDVAVETWEGFRSVTRSRSTTCRRRRHPPASNRARTCSSS